MPHSHTIEIWCSSRSAPELDGYLYSEQSEAWIPEDEATRTMIDGICHQNEVSSCGSCNEDICHDDNAGFNLTHIEDVDEWWCESCRDDHAHYHERSETYNSEPEEGGLNDYHSQERDLHAVTNEHPYRIGFEVEKEDRSIRDLIEDGLELPSGWVCERDGSLDDDTGFELVSPAFNINERELLVQHVRKLTKVLDADCSTSCGGHISISDRRFTPIELSERIRPLFPLLLALYPKRLTGGYCKAMTDKEKGRQEKYQAFFFEPHRIELRVPSAVKTAKSLMWRFDLIAHFLLAAKEKPLTWTWMRKQLGRDGDVRKMLLDVYTNPEDPKAGIKKVQEVIRLYSAFAGWYYRGVKHDGISEFIRNYVPPPPPPPSWTTGQVLMWIDGYANDPISLVTVNAANGTGAEINVHRMDYRTDAWVYANRLRLPTEEELAAIPAQPEPVETGYLPAIGDWVVVTGPDRMGWTGELGRCIVVDQLLGIDWSGSHSTDWAHIGHGWFYPAESARRATPEEIAAADILRTGDWIVITGDNTGCDSQFIGTTQLVERTFSDGTISIAPCGGVYQRSSARRATPQEIERATRNDGNPFTVGQVLMYNGRGPAHGHLCRADSRGVIRTGAIGVTWLRGNGTDMSGEDIIDLRPATPEEISTYEQQQQQTTDVPTH